MTQRLTCYVGLFFALAVLPQGQLSTGKLAAAPIEIATVPHDGPVDFEKEVLPLLRKNCLACHNASDAESDLVLETPAAILQGGSLGPAIVPGKGDESLLLKVSAHQGDMVMPPEDNDRGAANLSPQELGLMKRWIDEGGTGQVTGTGGPVQWQKLPETVKPIYALSLSPDGRFVACGRANQLQVYHVASGRLISQPTDAALGGELYKEHGAAHLDMVQSLAFHPSGDLLASGGFRNVKLWRRARNVRLAEAATEDAVRSFALDSEAQRAAWGLKNGKIVIWDIATSKAIRTLEGHTAEVTGLAFTLDGSQLVSGGIDKSVRLWKLGDGAALGVLETPAPIVALALVGAESAQLVAAGDDHLIRLWDIATISAPRPEPAAVAEGEPPAEPVGPLAPVREMKGHSQTITTLTQLKSAPTQFISAAQDGILRHWESTDGRELRQMNHGGPITSAAVSNDGKQFATASANKTARIWNAENGQQVVELKGDYRARDAVAQADRALTLARADVEYRKRLSGEAENRVKSETEGLKKAEEAQTAAAAEAKKKTEELVKPTADKQAADKLAAEAAEVLKLAQTAKTVAEKTVADTTAALQQVTEATAEAKQAADKSVQDATAKKQASDKVAADAAAAVTLAQTAKTAADKAAAEAAEDAKPAAQKAAAEAATALTQAEAAKKLADETVVAETAALQQATDAASKAKQDADKAVQEATAVKTAADKQLQTDTQALQQAEKKSADETKKADETNKKFKEAELAKQRADSLQEGAVRSVEASKQALERANQAVPLAKNEITQSEQRQKQQEEAKGAADKLANESPRVFAAIAFSADSQTLAVADEEGRILLANAANGEPIDTLEQHTGGVVGLQFLDDQTLFSYGVDKTAIRWQARPEWTLERTIGNIDDPSLLVDRVMALAFSPDGKLLATGSGDPSRSGQLKIWNTEDGQLVREIAEAHSDTIFDLAFSPDGTHLASAAADRFAKVFLAADGKLVRSLEGHTHHVLSVAWKADGLEIATAGADSEIKIWNFTTGEQNRTIKNYAKEVTSITYTGTGDETLSTSGDKTVRVFRSSNGGQVRAFGGGEDFMYCADASADGQIIAAAGQDGVVRVWDGKNGQVLQTLAAPADHPKLSAN